MRKLYEIDWDIDNCFDAETGEIFEDKLEELKLEREAKLEGVALEVKNLKAEIEALKNEEKALSERRKAAERRVDGFSNWLVYASAGEKFSTPKVALSFRKSQAVEILDENKVPREYWKAKTEMSVDKVKIKELLKGGFEIPGTELVERINLSIK